jgi:hypothetical protein
VNQGVTPREVWRRYKCSVRFPGCPCCGSVKLSRQLKETQRRAKAKVRLRGRILDALPETEGANA